MLATASFNKPSIKPRNTWYIFLAADTYAGHRWRMPSASLSAPSTALIIAASWPPLPHQSPHSSQSGTRCSRPPARRLSRRSHSSSPIPTKFRQHIPIGFLYTSLSLNTLSDSHKKHDIGIDKVISHYTNTTPGPSTVRDMSAVTIA